jgi:glycosyltransferase involved in cell wall biosynthesis
LKVSSLISPRIIVVLPAYNAERTLLKTYQDIPKDLVAEIILVDDASTDATVSIARQLALRVIVHQRNRGYGGNQKTCYRTALDSGADLVVMVHPDYQYDPTLIPEIVAPLLRREADAVLGSRMLRRGEARRGGMPLYKFVGNRVLTWLENRVLRQRLSEYHTGYRAYSRRLLETVPFESNSDNFVFDTEILIQAIAAGFRIQEISVPTRYFPEASSIDFLRSVEYGFAILLRLLYYLLWKLTGYQGFRITNAPLRRKVET